MEYVLGDIKDDHNAELYDKFRNMNSHVEGFCISCIDMCLTSSLFPCSTDFHTGDDLHVWCQKLSFSGKGLSGNRIGSSLSGA